MRGAELGRRLRLSRAPVLPVLVALVVVLFCVMRQSLAAPAPARSRRNEVDLAALERSWAAGDAAEELETSEQALAREMERKHAAGQLGSTMLFVTLAEAEADLDAFGELVTGRARLGGLDVKVYKLGAGKVVVALHRGWLAEPLYDMLLGLDGVASVEWKDRPAASKRRRRRKPDRQEL
jgi:hypothetical protein